MRLFRERRRFTDVSGYASVAQIEGIEYFVCMPDLFHIYNYDNKCSERVDHVLVAEHLRDDLGHRDWPTGIDRPWGSITPPGWTPGAAGTIEFDEATTNRSNIRIIKLAFGSPQSVGEYEIVQQFLDHTVTIVARRIGIGLVRHIIKSEIQ